MPCEEQSVEEIYASLISCVPLHKNANAIAVVRGAVRLEVDEEHQDDVFRHAMRCLTTAHRNYLVDVEFTVQEVIRLVIWQKFVNLRPYHSADAMFVACGNRLAAEAIQTDLATDSVARAAMVLRMAVCVDMLSTDGQMSEVRWHDEFWLPLSKLLFPTDRERDVMQDIIDGLRSIDRERAVTIEEVRDIFDWLILLPDEVHGELAVIKQHVRAKVPKPRSPVLRVILSDVVDPYMSSNM